MFKYLLIATSLGAARRAGLRSDPEALLMMLDQSGKYAIPQMPSFTRAVDAPVIDLTHTGEAPVIDLSNIVVSPDRQSYWDKTKGAFVNFGDRVSALPTSQKVAIGAAAAGGLAALAYNQLASESDKRTSSRRN